MKTVLFALTVSFLGLSSAYGQTNSLSPLVTKVLIDSYCVCEPISDSSANIIRTLVYSDTSTQKEIVLSNVRRHVMATNIAGCPAQVRCD